MPPPPGWIRLQDTFYTDEKLAELMADGRYDAVVLYFAAIAWCHQADSDGVLPYRARRLLIHNLYTDESAFSALLRADLIAAPKGARSATPTYTIRAYSKWQTTSDQRKRHAEVMRTLRSQADHKPITSTDSDQVVNSFSREEKRRDPPTPHDDESDEAAASTRRREILGKLIDAERTKAGNIRDRRAWERNITGRLEAEHGERIDGLVRDYPDAPADVIASTIRGETNNLRFWSPAPLVVHNGGKP